MNLTARLIGLVVAMMALVPLTHVPAHARNDAPRLTLSVNDTTPSWDDYITFRGRVKNGPVKNSVVRFQYLRDGRYRTLSTYQSQQPIYEFTIGTPQVDEQRYRMLARTQAGKKIHSRVVTVYPVKPEESEPDAAKRASDEPVEEAVGGIVSGTLVAKKANYNKLLMCSTDCASIRQVSDLPDADAVLKVNKKTGEFASDEPMAPDTYRIRFDGAVYKDAAGSFGYLRLTDTGRYQVVEKFEDGTPFTVQEGQALDVGKLDLRSGIVIFASPLTAYGSSFGGPVKMTGLRLDMKALDISNGAKVIVKASGCGETYTTVVKKSGSFKFQWNDARAHQRYGKQIVMRVIIQEKGELPIDRGPSKTDLSQFKWKCG